MTRLVWATLLAVSAWLASPGGARSRASGTDERWSALAADDTPARPAPRTHETLSLLRQIALRGDGRPQQQQPPHARHPGAAADDPRAWRRVASAVRRAGVRAARPEPPRAAEALAFPYDATAPPPGRRA